jgi:hypothetical protein
MEPPPKLGDAPREPPSIRGALSMRGARSIRGLS